MLVLDLYESLDLFTGVCKFLNLAAHSFSPVCVCINRIGLLFLAYRNRRVNVQLVLALSHTTEFLAETCAVIVVAASLRDELRGDLCHRLLGLVMKLFQLRQFAIPLLLSMFLPRGSQVLLAILSGLLRPSHLPHTLLHIGQPIGVPHGEHLLFKLLREL